MNAKNSSVPSKHDPYHSAWGPFLGGVPNITPIYDD